MRVTVVTPWWENRQLAGGYWSAMRVAQPDEVIVIDNGSSTPLDFGALPTTGLRIIRNTTNVGFSRASNQGLHAATGDAVVFLNNDIVATGPLWLESLLRPLRPGVLVGAHLRHDPHTSVDGRRIAYLDGWCLAGMRGDLLELGGWDEDYEEPSYYGDNDLCLRAIHAGMTLIPAEVSLKHYSNVTSRIMDVRGVTARNQARFAARARELLTAA